MVLLARIAVGVDKTVNDDRKWKAGEAEGPVFQGDKADYPLTTGHVYHCTAPVITKAPSLVKTGPLATAVVMPLTLVRRYIV